MRPGLRIRACGSKLSLMRPAEAGERRRAADETPAPQPRAPPRGADQGRVAADGRRPRRGRSRPCRPSAALESPARSARPPSRIAGAPQARLRLMVRGDRAALGRRHGKAPDLVVLRHANRTRRRAPHCQKAAELRFRAAPRSGLRPPTHVLDRLATRAVDRRRRSLQSDRGPPRRRRRHARRALRPAMPAAGMREAGNVRHRSRGAAAVISVDRARRRPAPSASTVSVFSGAGSTLTRDLGGSPRACRIEPASSFHES